MSQGLDRDEEGARMRTAPGVDRVIQAFAFAPVTAALPGMVMLALYMAPYAPGAGWMKPLAIFGLIVGAWAYPVALVLGLPCYVLLHKVIRLSLLRSAIVGAVIGGLATMGFFRLAAPELRMTLTLGGRMAWPGLLAVAMASGALPGVVFWAIATRPASSAGRRSASGRAGGLP
jgi:hypothetical protein